MLKLFISAVFLLGTVLASAAPGRPMEFNVPYRAAPVVIDGHGEDPGWKNAVVLSNFLRTTGDDFADEPGQVKLCYDADKLYLFFDLKAFALDPASNQTAQFKAAKTRRDDHVWADDSVEIRLEKITGGRPFYLCVNANGAILDMAYENSNWNRKWDAAVEIKGRRGSGRWYVEMAIDLKSLGVKDVAQDGRDWRLNFIRFDQRLHKKYTLVRLIDGNHMNIDSFALMHLTPQTVVLQEPSLSHDHLKAGDIPFSLTSAQPAKAMALVWSGNRLAAQKQWPVNGGKVKLTPPPVGADAEYFLQFEFTDATGKLIGRTTTFPYAALNRELVFDLSAEQPFTVLVNGEPVSRPDKTVKNLKHPLHYGNNAVTFKAEPGTVIRGTVNSYGETFAVDTGKSVSVPNIMFKTTAFLPQFSDNTWRLTRNGTYLLFWDGSHATGWNYAAPLKQWQLLLDVPEQLEFLGASRRKYRTARTRGTRDGLPVNPELYRWEARGTVQIGGTTYRRYLVSRTIPVKLTGAKETWLERIVRNDDGCYLAFKAVGAPGPVPPVRFAAQAENGQFRELPNTLGIEILPPLDGKLPGQLAIMLKNEDGGVADETIARGLFDTIKSAGVNEYFGECYSDYLKQIGVRHFNFFNLMVHPHEAGASDPDLQELFKVHPRAKGRNAGGINPAYINRHPETWSYLSKAIERIHRLYPSLSGAWWDYEFGPFPGHLMVYPCFDPEVYVDFAKAYGIQEKLTYDIIKNKYAKEWIDFTCAEVGKMFGIVRNLLRQQGLPLYVYSGYQGCPNGKEYYNIDWQFAGPNVDRAYCGYGPDQKQLDDTRKCLDGKPFIGALLKMGELAQSDTPGAMVLKALSHGGGVLLWYECRYDGRTLANIAAASRVLSELEPMLCSGERRDEVIAATPEIRERMALFTHQGRSILVLVNDRNQDMTFHFELKNFRTRFTNRQTGAMVSTDRAVALKVPAGQVLILDSKAERK